MDRIVVSLGVALMFVAGACQAAGRAPAIDSNGGLPFKPKLKKFVPPSMAVIKSISKINSKNYTLRGAKQTCPAGGSCSIDVVLTELTDPADSTKKICSLKTSDIDIVKGDAALPIETLITFKLVITGTTTAAYAFKDTGIVVVREESAGMIPRDRVTVTDTTIDAVHKYRFGHLGRKAWYFPLVVQSIGTDITYMCGAGDPKMVNS
jgi:hypothetical protein